MKIKLKQNRISAIDLKSKASEDNGKGTIGVTRRFKYQTSENSGKRIFIESDYNVSLGSTTGVLSFISIFSIETEKEIDESVVKDQKITQLIETTIFTQHAHLIKNLLEDFGLTIQNGLPLGIEISL